MANINLLKKRFFDLIIVLLASPVWIPAMLLTAITILVTSGWPVIYLSRRYVMKDTYRTVVKFRAMVKNADQLANRDTITPAPNKLLNIDIQDDLYTPLGKILEKTHFTELPQLIQVFWGTLTLVGNRPMPENMLAKARAVYPSIEERFSIPSGITGPAQLAGRDRLNDRERLYLEITYAYICREAYSPLLDFHMLLITLCTPFGFFQKLDLNSVEKILYSYVNNEDQVKLKILVDKTMRAK